MADDEEVYVLSGEEFSESLVLLELQQPKTPQEQTKQYAELKNSFMALLRAYEDLRNKLASSREELSLLKKRKAPQNNGSKPSSPMHSSATSLNQSMATSDLAKIIMMYNDRVVDILHQVKEQPSASLPVPGTQSLKSDAFAQVECSTVDAQTQCDFAAASLSAEQVSQTGESLSQTGASPNKSGYSVSSSIVIADISDAEEEQAESGEPSARSDTLKPADPKISDTQLSRLLLTSSRQRNPSNSNNEIKYHCPICNLEFGSETLEGQAVAHLMQCSTQANSEAPTDLECPMCNKKFVLNVGFTQQDFEIHVQCCCDAGDLGAAVLD